MDYKGYKLLDKIILVCKDLPERNTSYGSNSGATYYQAYFVDPSNKSQLSSARNWAEWTESSGSYRNAEGKWVRDWEIDHKPVEFEFDNNGFTLELLDCAGGSSQGGKLSFWNCLVKKDDKTFKIGINSEMLLALLKDATFIKGVCQSPLIFITQKGKVGLTVEGSETYKQCVADRELKKDLKKSATSKFSFGDITKTPTITEAYLGTITQYYKFEGDDDSRYYWYEKIRWQHCTLTKLKKPITYHMFDTLWDRKSITDFKDMYSKGAYSYPDFKANCPKRSIDGQLEIDLSEKEFIKPLISKIYDYDAYLKDQAKYYHSEVDSLKRRDYYFYTFLDRRQFGFGLPELPEELLNKIKELGIRYVEEL